MSVQLTSMPELNRKAFDLLAKELGLADTVRFFSQLGWSGSNYSEERHALFAGLTIEEYRQAVAQIPVAPAATQGKR
jgi:hypothetical protein